VPYVNGPKPRTVPATAMVDNTATAVAASRCPKRNAAQTKGGI
jgi:hypothetical protein